MGRGAAVEPFAIAALVWAVVSIVIPVIGTIVAFVLAAKAADLIRRSRGERTGTQYVTAARIVAGAVLALWIIGGIAFLALRDDGGSNDNVAVPTQPPSTSAPPPVHLDDRAGHHHHHEAAGVTTTAPPPPTISVIPPPPTEAPTTTPPDRAAHDGGPDDRAAHDRARRPRPSRRHDHHHARAGRGQGAGQGCCRRSATATAASPNDERVVVSYTPGKDLARHLGDQQRRRRRPPDGHARRARAPPTDPPTHDSRPRRGPTTPTAPTTDVDHDARGKRTTQQQARFEAKQILQSIKPQITSLKLDITGVQLVGTYPIEATGEDDVVQVLYSQVDGAGEPARVPEDVRRAAGRGRAVPQPGVRPELESGLTLAAAGHGSR